MRTRENSVIISLRIERKLQREFLALSAALGTQPARKHRDAFLRVIEEMRAEVNQKRADNGLSTWETEWASRDEADD